MAPENSASIAEGPALKLFQSIFAFEPSAFSNHPLALPTIACGCVIFGNAPTRMTVPCPQPEIERLRMKTRMIRTFLFISSPVPVNYDWKNATLGFLLLAFLSRLQFSLTLSTDNIGQRWVFQNTDSTIANIKE